MQIGGRDIVATNIRERESLLRMTVRTLAIKLIVFAFTLVLSYVAPKPGSADVRPHPTKQIKNIRTRSRESFATGWYATGVERKDVLRARKRSSDRIAMELMMRMATGAFISLHQKRHSQGNQPKKRFPRPKNNIIARREVVGGTLIK